MMMVFFQLLLRVCIKIMFLVREDIERDIPGSFGFAGFFFITTFHAGGLHHTLALFHHAYIILHTLVYQDVVVFH